MIAWLKGFIIHKENNEIVLNINGVGHLVLLGHNQLLRGGYQIGQETELVIYTQVKEDEIRYFGFDSFASRSLFLHLISVNGIGPKMALNIIDQLSPNQIIKAIQKSDYLPFQNVSGVGKKTAQRIILDLKDKLKDQSSEDDTDLRGELTEGTGSDADLSEDRIEDVKSALKNLGFPPQQTQKVIQKHFSKGIELDDLIKKCLSDLS